MSDNTGAAPNPPRDLHEHLAALDAAGLLVRIDRPINKDTQLQPLVRWQFIGGMPEDERKAFLFTHVVDSKGKRYDMPVLLGALAGSPRIYAMGMGRPTSEIGPAWMDAVANPVPPVTVATGACQEVVISGDALKQRVDQPDQYGSGNQLRPKLGTLGNPARNNGRNRCCKRQQKKEFHQAIAVVRRQLFSAYEKMGAVGHAVANGEIHHGGHRKVRQDFHQGVNLVFAPHRAQFQKCKSGMHSKHHHGAQQYE
jgi:hypothetical protein